MSSVTSSVYSRIVDAAENAVNFCDVRAPLTPKASAALVDGAEAVLAVIDREMGLSEQEGKVLLAYFDTLLVDDRYEQIVVAAYKIRNSRERERYTHADREILRRALDAIQDQANYLGEPLKEYVMDENRKREKAIIEGLVKLKDLYPGEDSLPAPQRRNRRSNPRASSAAQMPSTRYHCAPDTFERPPAPKQAETVVSASPSVLSSVRALSNLTDMDLPNMTPENARKLFSLMKRHPETFKVAQGNTSNNRPVAAAYGSLPRIGHLPSLPGFEELADSMLPDSAEELECMMNERLDDRRRLMECVVKHDALLFRIKVKIGLIRRGENERR